MVYNLLKRILISRRSRLMTYVFVKDAEGFVYKKQKEKVTPEEHIIAGKEFRLLSAQGRCKQKFTHGGKREGAGRKRKFEQPLIYQVRVTEDEKQFLTYAREHHIDYLQLMKGKN